jgi:hypothetical protein
MNSRLYINIYYIKKKKLQRNTEKNVSQAYQEDAYQNLLVKKDALQDSHICKKNILMKTLKISESEPILA